MLEAIVIRRTMFLAQESGALNVGLLQGLCFFGCIDEKGLNNYWSSLPGAETCLNDPVRNPSFSRLRGVFKASRNGSPEGIGGNKVANGENGGETRRESGYVIIRGTWIDSN